MTLVQFTGLQLIIFKSFFVDVYENCVKQLLAAPMEHVDGVLLPVTTAQ